MGCYFGHGSGVSRQGQHPLFAAFPGRAAKERKRQAKFLNGETDATSSELHPPLHKRLGGRERRSPAAGATEQSLLTEAR